MGKEELVNRKAVEKIPGRGNYRYKGCKSIKSLMLYRTR